MDSYDTRRVIEEAIENLNTPKGWLIVAGSVTALYFLNQKGVFKMGSYDTRRMLEQVIDKVGDIE